MSYAEALRLSQLLARDPSTWLCASVSRWEGPRSTEWLVLADLFDLTHAANSDPKKRPKPYPRPYPPEGAIRRGRTKLDRAEVIAILNAHGHQIGG